MSIAPKTGSPFRTKTYPAGSIPQPVLVECVRFRTEIYVAEGYLPEPEQSAGPDCYDGQSAHICVREAATGNLIGYCRMIAGEPYPLPIVQLYPELKRLVGAGVEVSRFSVRNRFRGKLNVQEMAPLFLLAREMLAWSHRQGIHQWYCLIDERFQNLCERFFKMEFRILGEPEFYMGSPSVPCIIDLSESFRKSLRKPELAGFWETRDLKAWISELRADEN